MTSPLALTPQPMDSPEDGLWRRRVAHAFSRAAPRYTQLARAQHEMGEALWAYLPDRRHRTPWNILDLGCGPGHWSTRLASQYGPTSRVIGLDLSYGMLERARAIHGSPVTWLCADAGALPLHDGQQDVVFSNLAIQWCLDLDVVLSEIHRVLRPRGRALVNTLGPGTLFEVGHAWSNPSALLTFHSRDRHVASARLAGFSGVHVEARTERFFYPNLSAVMASIKGVGAQASRPGARLSRSDLARASRRFEALREPDGLPVSYTRLTLVLDKE
ncbi:methyltransferase domain-containing protein [Billgrantia endophytica]|uniref:SAM-dependent methyltransferase n=1 Tax=Billgrantia endophytica TaxID=2033802 RepID=A0A2N7U8Y8_9GAMM|nr:methyltransferase domain-containing protein [Halomonas endophytica]PMR76907.1 SAM-dependent methyltransferase [Halomonas endophytica]